MTTETNTPTKPKRSIRYLSPYKIKVLKNRVRRIGYTYWQIGQLCDPPVTEVMVQMVMNGWKTSSNVMGTIQRLEAEKAAREAEQAAGNGKSRAGHPS